MTHTEGCDTPRGRSRPHGAVPGWAGRALRAARQSLGRAAPACARCPRRAPAASGDPLPSLPLPSLPSPPLPSPSAIRGIGFDLCRPSPLGEGLTHETGHHGERLLGAEGKLLFALFSLPGRPARGVLRRPAGPARVSSGPPAAPRSARGRRSRCGQRGQGAHPAQAALLPPLRTCCPAGGSSARP